MLLEKQDKIRIVLIGLCLLITQLISAQEKFHKELSMGVNAGAVFSTVRFNPSVRQSTLNQIVGGISARFISESHVGLLSELNYSQRGWKEYDPDHPEIHYTRALNYLECPVFTHVYFDMGKHFRVIFNLGPQIGYLLNERQLESNINMEDQDVDSRHILKAQRRFDWGLCFGGGVELRTGIGSFILDGRYYYGLSDVFNNTRADDYAASSNQVVNVKLTYLFKTKN